MAFVPLTLATGGTILVQPETVDELQDVPLALIVTPPGPPCSYLSLLDGSRYVLTGTAAANAAALAAGSSGGSSGTYLPTFGGFTGQVAGAASAVPWFWHRIGGIVSVWGEVLAQLNPGPGQGTLEASLPFPLTGGTSCNTVANMAALPPTPAPEAPVFPYTIPTAVGFTLNVTGIYPTARVMCAFSFQTP